MKVMFVGGGRRASLAKRFIAEGFAVYAYETDTNAPIGTVATLVPGLKWSDPHVEKHILNTFDALGIDLAIPLQDHATVVLSRIAPQTSTRIPTASEDINNVCLNKKVFEDRLKDFDFYPGVTDNCEKVIVKPVFGFGSKGISIIPRNELQNQSDKFVVQRFIDGGFEISVDAYFDKKSQMIDAVPRHRLEIQGGEVSRSTTLDRTAYNVVEITKFVGESLGLIGPICSQYIIGGGKAYIMEINARFGGGVILSLEAGLNIVKMIKQEYIDNTTPSSSAWKSGLSMVRYFQEHFYE